MLWVALYKANSDHFIQFSFQFCSHLMKRVRFFTKLKTTCALLLYANSVYPHSQHLLSYSKWYKSIVFFFRCRFEMIEMKGITRSFY